MFEAWPTPSLPALVIAVLIDRLWGEVPSPVHPVVWMGVLIRRLTRWMPRRPASAALLLGTLVAFALPALFGLCAWALSTRLRALEPPTAVIWGVEGLVFSTTFAIRMLGDAVMCVARALHAGELDEARQALRALCSRDAGPLSATQLSGAAIESAAENASDSFVAPLVFYCAFGLPGAMAYRAINTLDAMLGYHGELEYLGKASARLDDLVNLLPSRLTAVCLFVAALGRGASRRALSVWWRDRQRTESPNAGHPMAMMAGLLPARLDKVGAYTLGAELPEPRVEQVTRAWSLVATASWLVVACAALFVGLVA